MSDILLRCVGGAVTDREFRDALNKDVDTTIKEYNIVDKDAVRELKKIFKGPNRQKVVKLMSDLEPFICDRENAGVWPFNCWPFIKLGKPPSKKKR